MLNFDDFHDNILGWAHVRKFKEGTTELHQQVKGLEEIGEFIIALDDYQRDSTEINKIRVMLETGDMAVCIVISNSFNATDHFESEFYDYDHEVADLSRYLLWRNYGQSMNCLKSICRYYELNFEDCLELVWGKIKNRKGMWIDKFYVKYDSMTEEQQQEFDRCDV